MNPIEMRRKMIQRIRLKITPDVVNAEFRAALERYNKRKAERKQSDRAL